MYNTITSYIFKQTNVPWNYLQFVTLVVFRTLLTISSKIWSPKSRCRPACSGRMSFCAHVVVHEKTEAHWIHLVVVYSSVRSCGELKHSSKSSLITWNTDTMLQPALHCFRKKRHLFKGHSVSSTSLSPPYWWSPAVFPTLARARSLLLGSVTLPSVPAVILLPLDLLPLSPSVLANSRPGKLISCGTPLSTRTVK